MNLADVLTLRQLARGMPRSGVQAQRLDAFYGPQADRYNGFRERLLAGRADLLTWLALGELTLVDLCAPPLEIARGRCKATNSRMPQRSALPSANAG